MSLDAKRLYELLPAVYRLRDAQRGGVLWELVQVIGEQVTALEEDLDQLYDDQFIETCADWVVPYIGDLVGYRDLYDVSPRLGSSRAEVANTIAFRRRKGTAAMLEQLARDVTGWDAAVVEFFQRLATTQYLNHVRPGHFSTVNLRHVDKLARLNTPFDKLAHTLDVRRIATAGGWYNIPNIGIFLWRVQSYPLLESPPASVDSRRFRLHPLGIDAPLYNRPHTEAEISHLATPSNVPMPLVRRYLSANLASHYGLGASLWVRRGGQIVAPDQVKICDLSDTGSGQWANMPASGLAIDPELGRLAFAQDVDTTAEPLRVSFRYGFTGAIGGGGYERTASLARDPDSTIRVPQQHASLQAALNAAAGRGVVEVAGSGRYEETPQVVVAQNQRLDIQASNRARPTLVLDNDLRVGGGDSGEMIINGLLISGGSVRIPAQIDGSPNRLQRLTLKHCTLVPGIMLAADGSAQHASTPSLIVEIPNLELELESCIVGPLQVHSDSRTSISDSIVDAINVQAAAYSSNGTNPGGPLRISATTVIGTVTTRSLPLGSNSIFLGHVDAQRVQDGCVRYSYLPPDSHVPRRYRCQPGEPVADADAMPVRPRFTSLLYGDAGYCQLRPYCAAEIREGADDESEMGAFHSLRQAQRETNLRIRLREYLRFGLEAGIFYAS